MHSISVPWQYSNVICSDEFKNDVSKYEKVDYLNYNQQKKMINLNNSINFFVYYVSLTKAST